MGSLLIRFAFANSYMEKNKWKPIQEAREIMEFLQVQIKGACEKLKEETNAKDQHIRNMVIEMVDRSFFMKRFLILSLTAGFFSPIAANAKSVYLILLHGSSGVEKIEISDMTKCQEQGEAFKGAKNKTGKKSFICIEA